MCIFLCFEIWLFIVTCVAIFKSNDVDTSLNLYNYCTVFCAIPTLATFNQMLKYIKQLTLEANSLQLMTTYNGITTLIQVTTLNVNYYNNYNLIYYNYRYGKNTVIIIMNNESSFQVCKKTWKRLYQKVFFFIKNLHSNQNLNRNISFSCFPLF